VAYSRKFPEQDRAIETVFSLMRQHPEGVTVNELNELIRAHEDKVRSEIVVSFD
jgi:predicted Zn-ribbon and HTH transcriptional regulator